MKLAILFPGQGSQFLGMAKEFRDNSTACAEIMAKAEEVCGRPLARLSDEGPMEDLIPADIVQPAITVANLVCWQAFREAVGGRVAISAFAGHSLGEYSALYASGAITASDALRLVTRRGELMGREGEKNPGGMCAVLGLPIDKIDEILGDYNGEGVVVAANHNTPEQTVISGTKDGLEGVEGLLVDAGAKVVPLNVSVANHSPLVAGAIPDFSNLLEEVEFAIPLIPVYFNVSAQKEYNPVRMKEMMSRQIASKVRWCEIITRMLAEGIDTFIEVGPKPVLKSMMKRIVPRGVKVTSLQFDSPEGLGKVVRKLGL